MKFMEKMKNYKTEVLFLILLITAAFKLSGQNPESVKVDLLNAPVLFKENGKSFQQVVANCRSEKDGNTCFLYKAAPCHAGYHVKKPHVPLNYFPCHCSMHNSGLLSDLSYQIHQYLHHRKVDISAYRYHIFP